MVQYTFNAPSELPCPTGVTTDPSDRCSREYGLAQVSSSTPEKTRAINDYLLKRCNTTLNEYHAKLDFNPADPSHFYIPTSCVVPSPHEGIIHIVHAHMHTRGASARIEVKQQDGTFLPLLDIPRWDWTWEAAYLLEQGAIAPAGRELRVKCEYDNGTANQWSLSTNEPGHGGPAAPPLQPPRYVVAGSTHDSDMCGAFLTLEKPPYKNATYPDICHEVQAIYDDVCATNAIDFLAAPCQGDLERSAVLLVQATEPVFRNYACVPQGPAANVGATCEAVNNCALACGAIQGLNNGIPPACLTACKANANSYGPGQGQPLEAASPAGSFRFDNLMQCSQPACSAEVTWQGYLDCLSYACTDLAKFCYAP